MKIIPVAAVLAAFAILPVSEAMAVDGKKAFAKRCKSCHDINFEKHRTGPNLAGIMGRKAGTTDFKKYKALKDVDFVWDDANMDGWIADSKKFQKANKGMFAKKNTTMSVKVKKAEERAAIIEYLKTK